ncbi:phage head closure protein [Ligilactobacillus equi]
MKNLNPSRLRYKAQFGKMGATAKRNPNTGRPIQSFVEDFSLWAGKYSLSLRDQIEYHGIDESISMVIFTRHNPKIFENQYVKFENTIYSIAEIQQDDGLPPDGFDLITLKKVTSNG